MGCESDEAALLRLALQGDETALGDLLMHVHDRLARVVRFRLDPRLRGRVDASDIVQETLVEAVSRFPGYRASPAMPFFLWIRFLAVQKLCMFHRRHLGAQSRDAAREVSLYGRGGTEVTSTLLAARLAGKLTSPSLAAVRAETRLRLEGALQAMEPIDREIIAMRHFEWLNNQETAQLLGISESAASNRYVRAIKRLKATLESDAI